MPNAEASSDGGNLRVCPGCSRKTPAGLARCRECNYFLGGNPAEAASKTNPPNWGRRIFLGIVFLLAVAGVLRFRPGNAAQEILTQKAATKAPDPPAPKIEDFSAKPENVTVCQGTAVITWKVSGATLVKLDGVSVSPEGSQSVSGIIGPKHFTLAASDSPAGPFVTEALDLAYSAVPKELWKKWFEKYRELSVPVDYLNQRMQRCQAACIPPERCQ